MMIPYRPRSRSTTLARYAAPALANVAAKGAASALAGYIPSLKQVGKAAGDLYSGFSTRKQHPRVEQLRNEDITSYAPVAISSRVVSRKARVRTGPKVTTVTHRELINSAVAGSIGFVVQSSLSLNPGLAATFPWLSVQATQYQEYRFRKLEFEWIPIAPTSTQGDITLCVDYDASSQPPTTEVQASDLHGTVVDSVWKPICLRLDVKSMHSLGPRKFIRTGNVYGDVKTYDSGNFYLCSENETGASTVGKLYVSYTVDLFTPFNGPPVGSLASATSLHTNATAQTFTTGITANMKFANNYVNALNIVPNGTFDSFTLPSGTYVVDVIIGIRDTSNENLTVASAIQLNGATILAAVPIGATELTIANGTMQYTMTAVVTSNGSGAITIPTTLTGAAGTLTAVASECALKFTLA